MLNQLTAALRDGVRTCAVPFGKIRAGPTGLGSIVVAYPGPTPGWKLCRRCALGLVRFQSTVLPRIWFSRTVRSNRRRNDGDKTRV